ncbi:hypothetical protein Taro_033013 [Colocasia esculenta]|uniref:Uncharacterized protein n=1 Tax=Colocasia esculenta TaxID=4460 RepID=A0A843VMQ8_COLES|nr:hypothetical protein [Colocasia esculenta]
MREPDLIPLSNPASSPPSDSASSPSSVVVSSPQLTARAASPLARPAVPRPVYPRPSQLVAPPLSRPARPRPSQLAAPPLARPSSGPSPSAAVVQTAAFTLAGWPLQPCPLAFAFAGLASRNSKQAHSAAETEQPHLRSPKWASGEIDTSRPGCQFTHVPGSACRSLPVRHNLEQDRVGESDHDHTHEDGTDEEAQE